MRRFISFLFFLYTAIALGKEQDLYLYQSRDHSKQEDFKHIGRLYLLNWGGYYLSQPETFRNKGSFRDYKNRLGKIVFDMDSTNWNQIIHPYVGSQVYLYYRAFSYSRMESFFMTALQSALFEFTIETYTESASAQDLYQTPVLGSVLGILLEEGSLTLLNSDSRVGNFFGHLMNPMTLFSFFEGKSTFSPLIQENKVVGLSIRVEFL